MQPSGAEATDVEDAMEENQSNPDKLEGQLERWGAKLDELVAKADMAGQEAKLEARAHVEELRAKLAAARSKLAEAKASGSDKWDAFKEGLEKSWKELEGAFRKLAA
jgi:hypothetical protein